MYILCIYYVYNVHAHTNGPSCVFVVPLELPRLPISRWLRAEGRVVHSLPWDGGWRMQRRGNTVVMWLLFYPVSPARWEANVHASEQENLRMSPGTLRRVSLLGAPPSLPQSNHEAVKLMVPYAPVFQRGKRRLKKKLIAICHRSTVIAI